MINLNEIPLFCIHLPIAKDREKGMYEALNYLKDNKDYTVSKGISAQFGHKGISDSFKKVIYRANQLGHPQVIIIEDDIKFSSIDSKKHIQKALNTIPDDWDLLIGVSYNFTKDYKVNDHLVKVKDFSSLIFSIFNNTSYNKVLSHDCKLHKPNIDKYLSDLSINKEFNVYLIYPMIATETPGYSYHIKRDVNYDNLVEKYDILK